MSKLGPQNAISFRCWVINISATEIKIVFGAGEPDPFI
jgi:hypothetical protein